MATEILYNVDVPRTSQHSLRSAQNEMALTPFPKVSNNDHVQKKNQTPNQTLRSMFVEVSAAFSHVS